MVTILDVYIDQDEDGVYTAEIPDLKGCHTQGPSIQELINRLNEAISLYLGKNANFKLNFIDNSTILDLNKAKEYYEKIKNNIYS